MLTNRRYLYNIEGNGGSDYGSAYDDYGSDYSGGGGYGGGRRRRRLLAESEAIVDPSIVEKANMLRSSGSSMLIHFHSSYSASTTGFQMNYGYKKASMLVSAPLTSIAALVGVPVDFVLNPKMFTSTTVNQTFNYTVTLADGQNLTMFNASNASITFANLTLRVVAKESFTVQTLQLRACNVLKLCATTSISIVATMPLLPDRRSLLTCTNNTTNGAPVKCFTKSRNREVSAYSTIVQFDLSVEGAVVAEDIATKNGFEVDAEFTFSYFPSTAGGIDILSDGVSANTVTITSYATADATSKLLCDKAYIIIGGAAAQCALATKNGMLPAFTKDITISGIKITRPDASMTVVTFDQSLLSAVTPSIGSLFSFTFGVGTTIGVYEALILLGDTSTITTELTATESPDAPSKLTCYPLMVSVGGIHTHTHSLMLTHAQTHTHLHKHR
jgi:hypothetical protein